MPDRPVPADPDPTSEVRTEIDDGLATITIDRPAARNAISLTTIGELSDALDRLAASDVSVLVIRGAGDRAFVSGGDVKELAAIRDEEGAIAMASRMRSLLDRIVDLPMPVIAAMNGHALGGGAEVASAADIRIAADDIKIGFTQVRLAIMPAWGGAERLAEIVGRSQAMLLIASGRVLDTVEAHRIGLLDMIAPRAEFDETWHTTARQIAELAPGAARAIKSVVAAARPHSHPQLADNAVRAFAGLWTSEHHWEAAAGGVKRATS